MPRRYESSVRAERAVENRGRLVAAAHGLFMRQGWTATTMTQVGAAAGLARPTVYLHFDTKLDLLIACIDTALSDVPVRERSDYQAMEKGTLPQRAATAGRWLRRAYERSASIQRVLDDAAVSIPEAARVQTRMEQRRHDEFANACGLVLGGRMPPAALVDEVWALGSRLMWFKLADRGWSPDEWEAWFVRVVLDATDRQDRLPLTRWESEPTNADSRLKDSQSTGGDALSSRSAGEKCALMSGYRSPAGHCMS